MAATKCQIRIKYKISLKISPGLRLGKRVERDLGLLLQVVSLKIWFKDLGYINKDFVYVFKDSVFMFKDFKHRIYRGA